MADTISEISDTSALSTLYSPQEILDKDDFLQLLVTQLRHQDPLDPMDNTQFVSQLAEFSALEQMQNVSSGVESLSAMMQSINNSLASELLGKDVKYTGNTFRLPENDDAQIYYSLESKANVKINIYDENYELVGTVVQPEQLGGEHAVKWNGRGLDGQRMAVGRYSFEIEAMDSSGTTVRVETYSVDQVQGLKFDNGNAVLVLDGSEKFLGDILEILQTSQGGDK